MPQLTNDQIQTLAANHLHRGSGITWDAAGAAAQTTAIGEVQAILEDAAGLVAPSAVPLPPTLSPAQAWRKRHQKPTTAPPSAPAKGTKL